LQVYDRHGRFLRGWFVDANGTGGTRYRLRVNDVGQLEVLTAASDKLRVFTPEGASVTETELSVAAFGKLYKEFGQPNQCEGPSGEVYVIHNPPPGLLPRAFFAVGDGIRSRVDRIAPQGQRTTLIVTPWHKWFWMGPQPALTWFVFGLLLLFLTKSVVYSSQAR
jgi:hypothetical protein